MTVVVTGTRSVDIPEKGQEECSVPVLLLSFLLIAIEEGRRD